MLTPLQPESLSKCIKMCCQTYALMCNRRRGRQGKLFVNRFSSVPLESMDAQGAATLEIDLFSRRGDVRNAALWARWSTWGLHDGVQPTHVPRDLWTPSPWYLGLGAYPIERQRAYRALMRLDGAMCDGALTIPGGC